MLAIIDGDCLAYDACEGRWISKAVVVDDTVQVALDWDGKRRLIEYTKEEDREYMERSWRNFKRELDFLLDELFCTEYVMAVKDPFSDTPCFRDLIHPGYKANRSNSDPNRKGLFVPGIRQLAILEDLAVPATGYEADDLIRTWAEQCRAAGKDYVICSVDKDLLCIPGRHYRMHKRELVEVDELSAMRHYYAQILTGDSADNIPGLRGVGPVRAEKVLAGCETREQFQEKVVEEYIRVCGNAWKEALLWNGKLIHILRHPNDYFTLRDWPIVEELKDFRL